MGRTPSLQQFVASTGVSKHSLLRLFPRWNDAVSAARLQPCRRYSRPEDSELLRDWGQTVRSRQALPSRRAYLLNGKYQARTVERRFGGWESVPQAFRKFAKGKREWADVVALLAARARQVRGRRKSAVTAVVASRAPLARLKGRVTYGNPMDFRGLRHEPVNEQGVVLLFGMVAEKLGYMVETVQNGFPDCEAKRRIGPERWQRVQIEFEFESRNFREHGHPMNGCDLIVCWRHNWVECPKNIEVVELSSVIQSLANAKH